MTRDEANKILDGIYTITYGFDEGYVCEDVNSLIDKIFDEIEAQQKPKKVITLMYSLNDYPRVNPKAFNEWMAYKKYKNKGAITKTLKMLNKYDYQTQQEMVDKSIMNEYKGLFEPKGLQKSNVNIDMALEHNVFDMIEQKAQQETKELR
jgi:hypothetical protein